MTTKEFSDAFDALLNSYSTQTEFGDSPSRNDIVLDEYEKSLLLTQAQEQIVTELYSGRTEKGNSFEKTEEVRKNLKSLIRTDTLSPYTPKDEEEAYKGVSKYSKFFELPPDVLFITYESATLSDESAGCKNGSELLVTPVTQDEFYRVMSNPFRQANKNRALRLDNNNDVAEIVSKYNISAYTIRYLAKPAPIVLANFEGEGLSIDGESNITECELDSVIHRDILTRAVEIALASRSIQNRK